MYHLPAAPQSIGGILDDGFRLFRATWRQLLPVAIAASLISSVPQLMIGGLGSVKPGEPPPMPALGAGFAVTFIVAILLTTVAYAVMVAAVDRAAHGGPASLRDALGIGIRRAPAVLRTAFLGVLGIVVGLILLVIPGIYLMVALYPAFLLPIAEHLGARQSFRRAFQLVKGSWWRTAGVLSVLGLLIIALGAIMSFAAGLAIVPFIETGDPDAQSGPMIAIQFIVAVMLAPLIPLSYCVMYAVYTDLRLRKDGGDLLERAAVARN
ncbi:MAG: hypothetical protein ABL989_10455 [Gammaproteobacteria bacterium]